MGALPAMQTGTAPRAGGLLSGRLHLKPGEGRILLAVEGEANSIALWQVVTGAGWPIDVLEYSPGDSAINELITLAGQYGASIVWTTPAHAPRLALALDSDRGGADVLYSPRDASKLLVLGLLESFLQERLGELYHRLGLRIGAAHEIATGADRDALSEREERLTSAGVALVRAGLM